MKLSERWHVPQFSQSGIADLRPRKTQRFQFIQSLQMSKTRIGNLRVAQVEGFLGTHPGQLPQGGQAVIGDARPVQLQRGELRERQEMWESVVGDGRVVKI